MRPGGGKQKGAQFERDACVMLSKWLTDDVQMDVFWRSAMSGGRATVTRARTGNTLKNQVGDISCIDPVGQAFIDKFAVEVKFYADLDYIGLLTGKGKLLQFWAEIKKQASDHNKHPFLIARQNRMLPTVCLDKSGMRQLGLRDVETLLISIPHGLYLFDAAHFFKVCTPFL